MSTSLVVLSSVVIGLGAIAVLQPRLVFQYPFMVGLFLSVWLLPQAWAVERDGLVGAFDPTPAWTYMTLCVVFIVTGYYAGRATNRQRLQARRDEISSMYSEKRMTQAAVALLAVGAISYVLMSRASANVENATMWTGVITVYALFSQCLVFAAALTFIVYLRNLDKRALILFLIAAATFSPVLLFAVKREFIFQFCMIVVCGLHLVRGFVPPRALLLAGVLVGAFIVNKAGDIRFYVKSNDSSLIGALTSKEVLTSDANGSNQPQAPEVAGAVTDIAISISQGGYFPGRAIWNGAVWRYFPAFIFGREAKDKMMIAEDQDILSNRYSTIGATRTGFSDTFRDYWYLGVFGFAFLGFFYGFVFELASAGGLRGQYLYVSMLGTGLHGITHAFQEFICTLPFLMLVIWLPFRYARINKNEIARLATVLQSQRS